MTLARRVVVDSSRWIEVFTGGELAEHFLAQMADERSLVVPAITIFEVFKWVLHEHGEAQAIQAVAAMRCSCPWRTASSWPRPGITRLGCTPWIETSGASPMEWVDSIS